MISQANLQQQSSGNKSITISMIDLLDENREHYEKFFI